MRLCVTQTHQQLLNVPSVNCTVPNVVTKEQPYIYFFFLRLYSLLCNVSFIVCAALRAVFSLSVVRYFV
jgi:hypothetical protein